MPVQLLWGSPTSLNHSASLSLSSFTHLLTQTIGAVCVCVCLWKKQEVIKQGQENLHAKCTWVHLLFHLSKQSNCGLFIPSVCACNCEYLDKQSLQYLCAQSFWFSVFSSATDLNDYACKRACLCSLSQFQSCVVVDLKHTQCRSAGFF